jgi:hypothetical protein
VDHFFFTVMWLLLSGMLSLLDLVCLGLCLEELLTCLPIDGILEGRGVLRFLKMVPICIFLCVWKKRNPKCFEDLEHYGGYFSFIFSYFVSSDGSFFVPIVA